MGVKMQSISEALARAGIEHQVIALRSPMFQTPARRNRLKRRIPERYLGSDHRNPDSADYEIMRSRKSQPRQRTE